MIRYLYADQLDRYPSLKTAMFEARADQFKTRLGWDVQVNSSGQERDAYDDLNPLYLIWENADGSHGGSLRLLPTTGRTMVNDHFTDIIGGGEIRSHEIWECTRFCLSRGAEPRTAAALMMAAGECMKRFGIAHCVAVFDARMIRIYRMIGASPEVLGTRGEGRAQISIGLWELSAGAINGVAEKSGVSLAQSRNSFELAFGESSPELKRKSA
ncbi:MAG: acyl-homoserine-lactone synthase [Pseudomonadota bacterium]